jgi:hypothetical protein
MACKGGEENCISWNLEESWTDPGIVEIPLMVSAYPVFVVGTLAAHGLGRYGVSEVSSFMFLMPILIAGWYYFLGWLLDRRKGKRVATTPQAPD